MRYLISIRTAIIGCFVVVAMLGTQRADAFVFQDRVSGAKSLAHYTMGHMYDLMGMTNRAVLEYQEALHFDENSYLIHLRLGTDYVRINMLPEAINHLSLVSKLNPDDLQSRYLLALIYSNQKEYDKAAAEYEYILKRFSDVEPENVEIYGYLGQLYYSQRKYDQAILQFEKILQLEPKNPDVMYLLGSLYDEVDQLQKALSILNEAITVDPNHEGSLNTLGYLYAEHDMKLDDAQKLIERALVVSPDNGAYLDSLGWVLYKKGEYPKALETLLKADKIMKDPVIYEHLGDVYLKLNNVEKALEAWNLSLELLPGQEEVTRKINSLQNNQASNQGVSL